MMTSGAELRISNIMRDSSVFFFGALKLCALFTGVCDDGGGGGGGNDISASISSCDDNVAVVDGGADGVDDANGTCAYCTTFWAASNCAATLFS